MECCYWSRGQQEPTRIESLRSVWNRLPGAVRSWAVARAAGRLIHWRVRKLHPRRGGNGGGNYTRFFRNMPQFELLRDLVLETPEGAGVNLASIGCSTGAELYSVVWMLRTARPDLRVRALGLDISEACIQTAARGTYPLRSVEVDAISETSYPRLFVRDGDSLFVPGWLREGVAWRSCDACSADLTAQFGPQDVVLANNFLFHMAPERSEACLRNVARLVAPNGYLFVTGVDPEVRSRVLRELGPVPVTARSEEIYTAQQDLLAAWPLRFWGVEPLDRRRSDWPARYATVFQFPDGQPPDGRRPAGSLSGRTRLADSS